jgi:hypothetical protein
MSTQTRIPKKLPVALAALITSVFATPASGQAGDGLTIDGSMRVRVETLDGQFRPNAAASDTLVTLRSTLAASYRFNVLRIGGEILDTRAYAENKHSSLDGKDEDALEPLQAYLALDLHNVASQGDKASVLAGRFTMDIGSERLVARTDYANVHQSFLGGMFDWRSENKDRIVAFWTRPFVTLPIGVHDIRTNRVELDRANGATQFFGASATKAAIIRSVSGEIYVYRLVERDLSEQATRNRRLTTLGFRVRRAPKPTEIDFEFEGVLQGGLTRGSIAASDVRNLGVRASYVHAETGWTKQAGWTPRFSLQFDYGSGGSSAEGRYGRFDSLYGARRFDISPSGLYGAASRSNILSPAFRAEAKPSKLLDLSTTLRGLWLADATDSFGATGVRDRTGRSGKHAGTQVEIRVRQTLIPNRLKVDFGGDILIKGQFLKAAPNAPSTSNTHYGYAEIAATF